MVNLHITSQDKLKKLFTFIYVNLAYATIYFSPGVEHGGQIPLFFLFLLSIPLIFSKKCYIDIDKKFIVAFALMFVSAIPLAVKSGAGEALDAPSRFIIIATVFTALYRIPVTPKWLIRSAILACSIATGVYFFEILAASTRRIHRVGLGIGILESAYTLTIMFFICITGFLIEKDRIWKVMTVISAVAAIIIIIQTGTRGAWLAVLITGLIYMRFLAPTLFWRRALMISVSCSVILILSYNLSSTVSKRVDTSVTEFQLLGKLEKATSTNRRLIYWEQALEGFFQSPLTGINYEENAQLRRKYAKQYNVKLTGTDDGRSSSHNEILNAMVKKGMFGLIAVLLIYLLPLKHFLRKLKSTQPAVKPYALAGISTISVMFISGLTEAPLMHTSVSVTYGMVLILLYHSIRNEEISCSPSS